MGQNGGARPGAGRPPGSLGKRTQEIILAAADQGILPVEVLLQDMRYFHKLGEEKMREAEQTKPGKEQAKNFRAALQLKDLAKDCAVHAAPYVHPKLAAMVMKTDGDQPLQFDLRISFEDSDKGNKVRGEVTTAF